MAIVVDDTARSAGLVTLEDLSGDRRRDRRRVRSEERRSCDSDPIATGSRELAGRGVTSASIASLSDEDTTRSAASSSASWARRAGCRRPASNRSVKFDVATVDGHEILPHPTRRCYPPERVSDDETATRDQTSAAGAAAARSSCRQRR